MNFLGKPKVGNDDDIYQFCTYYVLSIESNAYVFYLV